MASFTQDPAISEHFEQAFKHSKASRDDYFEALQVLDAAHEKTEKEPGNFIAKFFQDREKAKVEAALKEVSDNDRRELKSIFLLTLPSNEQGKVTKLSPVEAEKAYNQLVDKIVAKYSPQDVEACRKAGQVLFDNQRTFEQKAAALRGQGFWMAGIGLMVVLSGLLLANSKGLKPFDATA